MMYVGYGTVNNDNNTSTMCLQYGTGWKILLFAAFVHQYRKLGLQPYERITNMLTLHTPPANVVSL